MGGVLLERVPMGGVTMGGVLLGRVAMDVCKVHVIRQNWALNSRNFSK